MTPAIELQHLNKQYAGQPVVADLSLTVAPGELFVLVGASGSGKTTTLKMVNRLIEPDAGTIYFKGQAVSTLDVHALRLQIGYVLQQIALFPTMTVAQNIAVIPEMLKLPKRTTTARMHTLMNAVGLAPKRYANRYPHELSGGEQQRVGIVRALIGHPPVVLMDEPFSALDPLARTQLQDLVLQLHVQLGMTILFVTHDVTEALKLGERIGVLRHGQLQQVAPPAEILAQPVNAFVADFFAGAHRVWLDSPLATLATYGTKRTEPLAHSVNNRDVFAGEAPLRMILSALANQTTVTVLAEPAAFTLTPTQVWCFLAAHASSEATINALN